MAPKIEAEGYCVYALTYGRQPGNPPPFNYNGGLKEMEESAGGMLLAVQGLGAVLGYLAGGVVIGPFVLGLVGGEGDGVGVQEDDRSDRRRRAEIGRAHV